MKKIRLNPDALEVHSFATATGPDLRLGTSIQTFCTEGGSCIDGPCKPDTRISQCLC
ncbi:MAG TPA: hypothetical protein VE871_02795 [Longimicrobium sp.]|nr:hypothetical protein [Longimicrobium sp.]